MILTILEYANVGVTRTKDAILLTQIKIRLRIVRRCQYGGLQLAQHIVGVRREGFQAKELEGRRIGWGQAAMGGVVAERRRRWVRERLRLLLLLLICYDLLLRVDRCICCLLRVCYSIDPCLGVIVKGMVLVWRQHDGKRDTPPRVTGATKRVNDEKGECGENGRMESTYDEYSI